MKNFIATSLQSIVAVSSCLLVFTVYLLFNSFLSEKEKEEKDFACETIGWCGVSEPAASSMQGLGKTLFKNNCASCHNKDMKSKMTGPSLGGVTQRWSAFPKEDLYRWIRSSQKMIDEGHPKAKELWDEWKPTVMTNFSNLTDEEIEGVLSYIEMVGY
ncbi:MAG: cytochrome c [Saprospiraceae bacterium]